MIDIKLSPYKKKALSTCILKCNENTPLFISQKKHKKKMYKILLLCALLLVSTTTALECSKACTLTHDILNGCSYTCKDACGLSASDNTNAFVANLKSQNISCNRGYNAVNFKKTAQTGLCVSYEWNCGPGCKNFSFL